MANELERLIREKKAELKTAWERYLEADAAANQARQLREKILVAFCEDQPLTQDLMQFVTSNQNPERALVAQANQRGLTFDSISKELAELQKKQFP